MKKKYSVIFAALALGCLLFTACPTELRHESVAARGEPWGVPPFTGDVRGEARGYNVRSPIIVRLYLVDGIIVDAFVDPSRESPGFWEGFPAPTRARIIASNSMNISIDGLGGATTARAILQAGRNALLEIPGVTADDL